MMSISFNYETSYLRENWRKWELNKKNCVNEWFRMREDEQMETWKISELWFSFITASCFEISFLALPKRLYKNKQNVLNEINYYAKWSKPFILGWTMNPLCPSVVKSVVTFSMMGKCTKAYVQILWRNLEEKESFLYVSLKSTNLCPDVTHICLTKWRHMHFRSFPLASAKVRYIEYLFNGCRCSYDSLRF